MEIPDDESRLFEHFKYIQSTDICFQKPARVDAAASPILLLFHGVRILLGPTNTLGRFRVGHRASGDA
jgi:hypothetical protein